MGNAFKNNNALSSVLLAVILAAVFASLFHFWPLASDDFQGVQAGGQVVKAFHQGWPVKYVATGELKESWNAVAFKMLANFVLFFFVGIGLIQLWKVRGAGIRKRGSA